ncbi:hypothetical protein [Streptomyces subrutilus]|uniref:hypothetical protein n=1 Tax=Streptomyces subrutilus TaxID=36818 RepID=UPI001FCAF5F0|nr:hypothetical protein [Streptomyces subrutilus]
MTPGLGGLGRGELVEHDQVEGGAQGLGEAVWRSARSLKARWASMRSSSAATSSSSSRRRPLSRASAPLSRASPRAWPDRTLRAMPNTQAIGAPRSGR